MNDKPVYWTPYPVGDAFSDYLASIALQPRAEDVDPNHRPDLGRVLNDIPVSDAFYSFGRARAGEARSICSRGGRLTYGHLQFARMDAPNKNEHTEEGDHFDHQLLFARRLR
jgi:hypothetical protein